MSGATIRIKQYRSGIQAPTKHKLVLRALGLGRINRVVERPDNEAVRGMVNTIPHLVRIVDGE
jgi:large subunit ribosomal protein L30